jgi:hypothetical protein
MAQPTTLRVAQAMTVARKAHPPHVGMYLIIADHFLARGGGGEVAIHQVGNRPGRALLGGARPPRLAGDQAQLAYQARAISDPACTPQRASSAVTRRNP